jgi:hypothetical protein
VRLWSRNSAAIRSAWGSSGSASGFAEVVDSMTGLLRRWDYPDAAQTYQAGNPEMRPTIIIENSNFRLQATRRWGFASPGETGGSAGFRGPYGVALLGALGRIWGADVLSCGKLPSMWSVPGATTNVSTPATPFFEAHVPMLLAVGKAEPGYG